MSWYTSITLGYVSKTDGKIYPFGPFDKDGNLKNIIETSRSFTTDLKDFFEVPNAEVVSQKLVDALDIKVEDGENLSQALREYYVGVCPLDKLPSGDYMRRGYFLIEDVHAYESGEMDAEDLFYDCMGAEEYAARAHNELVFGFRKEKDEFGNVVNHSMADYMYYSYPDYQSKEYEASLLHIYARTLVKYSGDDIKEIVAIKTEG